MPIDTNNDPNEIVSNTPAQPTAQQPTPYYAEGISTPPNGGEVSSVSTGTPADATSTPDDAQMVSNGPTNGPTTAPTAGPTATPAQPPIHPSVQKAGIIHEIAQALGGGPRFRTTIDPNSGTVTRTAVPLSGREIGLAIAMEALSGSLAGLGAKGTNATGQAAAAGLQQGQAIAAQRQQAQQESDQQAQQSYQNQKQSLAQKAQIFEANSRTILNTAEAESRGADTIQKLADQNKNLIASYDSAGVLQQRNVTQEELLDGMQSGKYNATEVLGPIDGYRLLGDGKVEATHALITNPEAKVPLTAAQWNSYADAHVPGWPKLAPGTDIADNFKVSGLQLAQANEVKNALTLAQERHDEVTKALSESDNPKVQALAAQVPTINSLLDNPKTGPGLASALQRYQKYVSHSDLSHGMDLYESLQAMAQPSKSDGKGGFEPNPDAPYAQQIAQAYGGMGVLRAYHDEVAPLEIKSPAQAADMLASNDPGSRAYKYAKAWQRNYAAQQGQDAAARKNANGTGGTGGTGTGTGTGNGTDGGLSLVDQIGQGKIVPERMSYLLSRNPSLLEEVSQKYPDFDSSKAASYPKTYQDFTSGKTAQALNAGGTALQHLNELLKLNTPASHIYGTAAYTAYQNKVDTVADELAKFYGNSTVSGIESYKKTLDSTLPGNREAAIRTQAQSMGSKMDSYETTWKNAAPSAAYQAPMPGISDRAKAARAALDPTYKGNVPQPPQGAIGKVPGSDGRMYWTDGKNNLGVAQ